MIIFDLDYTLLNTQKFINNIINLFKVDEISYQKTSKEVFNRSNKLYNVYKHLDYLVRHNYINREEARVIKIKIIEYLKTIDQYLYPEAEEIVKKLFKQNHKLVLLTYGDYAWQRLKAKHLTIRKYFYKIIVTDKDKVLALNELYKIDKNIIFINDNAEEMIKINSKYPDIKLYLVEGPFSNNVQHNYPLHSLSDINIILN